MILATLLCSFCITVAPDGFNYFNGGGSFYTVFETERADETAGFATLITRKGGTGNTIGGQFNAHSTTGNGTVWGVATESVALDSHKGALVGIEALVADMTTNIFGRGTAPKIAVNAVYKSQHPDANHNSIAFWVTAYPNNGFETGLKFDRVSLKASDSKRATVLDLSEIPLEDLKNMDIIKLPNGKSLRWTGNELKVYSVD